MSCGGGTVLSLGEWNEVSCGGGSRSASCGIGEDELRGRFKRILSSFDSYKFSVVMIWYISVRVVLVGI